MLNMEERYKHITAEWARKTSETVLGNEAKKQLETCFNVIETAVQKNQKSASVSCSINEVAKKELESRGFRVEYISGDFRDPSYYVIHW